MDDIRRLLTLMTGDEKHDPASYSTLDVLRVLYERVLDVSLGSHCDEAGRSPPHVVARSPCGHWSASSSARSVFRARV